MFSTLRDNLFVLLQYILPQHPISRLLHWLTRLRLPWLKNLMGRWFISHFQVNMSEAIEADIRAYPDFNSFFTRALKPDVRPLATEANAVLCPVDGAVSQAGKIDGDAIFQAKGHSFSLKTLLGGSTDWADKFQNGLFSTLYLSPRDYHRIHMPLTGSLKQVIHVPGRLFSVNPVTTRKVPGLFARLSLGLFQQRGCILKVWRLIHDLLKTADRLRPLLLFQELLPVLVHAPQSPLQLDLHPLFVPACIGLGQQRPYLAITRVNLQYPSAQSDGLSPLPRLYSSLGLGIENL